MNAYSQKIQRKRRQLGAKLSRFGNTYGLNQIEWSQQKRLEKGWLERSEETKGSREKGSQKDRCTISLS